MPLDHQQLLALAAAARPTSQPCATSRSSGAPDVLRLYTRRRELIEAAAGTLAGIITIACALLIGAVYF